MIRVNPSDGRTFRSVKKGAPTRPSRLNSRTNGGSS
jgi:hypothetical protein